MLFRVSALALLASSALAFAPPSTKVRQSLFTSYLSATQAPEVFCQNRVAEPSDAASVGAAAALLSDKFPNEPFVVQYRARTIHDEEIDLSPTLDLTVLKEIKIDNSGCITTDPGVSIDKLANFIQKSGNDELMELFYFLPALGSRSVVETAVDPRFAKFQKAVKSVEVVDADGAVSTKQLSDVNAYEDIVISVTLEAPPREKNNVVARWYVRKYADVSFPDIKLEDDVKVIVHKYGMFNKDPNVIVFVDGGRKLDLPEDKWNEIVLDTPLALWAKQRELAESCGFDELNASATLDTSKVNPTAEDLLSLYQSRKENLLTFVEKGKIRVNFDARYPPDLDDKVGDSFELDKVAGVTLALDAGEKPKFSKRTTKETPELVKGTVIPGFKGEVYDGVRGQMQEKRYQYATSSYDNSMNPSLIVYPLDSEDVSTVVKWATDESEAGYEARRTLAHPSGNPYNVMGRGGGHQYCGVSCDNDALIVSMDFLTKIENVDYPFGKDTMVTGPDGEPQLVKRQLLVGTGNKLKPFATQNNIDPVSGEKALGKNKHMGCTIPHGECPKVGIGGHSQSGGYGHIARAFGLAIDYIYGFKIVVASGEIKTVTKDSEDEKDRDLYWAVMGGSPGAFGVTTELIIHPILDEDYPHSTAFARSIIHTNERMDAVIKILEDFINRSKAADENAIAPELDLMCSLSSNNGNRLIQVMNDEKDSITPNQDVILFELECSDTSNPLARKQMDEIMDRFEKEVASLRGGNLFSSILERTKLKEFEMNGKDHYKLSEMSLAFVRSPPGVTANGRENRKPYRKLCYGSKDKLKSGWAEAFSALLNEVTATKADVSCVFQVVVGGGKQASHGEANLNAIAHRDAQLHGLVFDLFRGELEEDIIEADRLSKKFELEVVNKYQTAYPKVMAQWASHGDLEMNKKEVWEKYYDNPATYHRLREIKKHWDPKDVFHSRFTIRPSE